MTGANVYDWKQRVPTHAQAEAIAVQGPRGKLTVWLAKPWPSATPMILRCTSSEAANTLQWHAVLSGVRDAYDRSSTHSVQVYPDDSWSFAPLDAVSFDPIRWPSLALQDPGPADGILLRLQESPLWGELNTAVQNAISSGVPGPTSLEYISSQFRLHPGEWGIAATGVYPQTDTIELGLEFVRANGELHRFDHTMLKAFTCLDQSCEFALREFIRLVRT